MCMADRRLHASLNTSYDVPIPNAAAVAVFGTEKNARCTRWTSGVNRGASPLSDGAACLLQLQFFNVSMPVLPLPGRFFWGLSVFLWHAES